MSLKVGKTYNVNLKGANQFLPFTYTGVMVEGIDIFKNVPKMNGTNPVAFFNNNYPGFSQPTQALIGSSNYRNYTYYNLKQANGSYIVLPEEWLDIDNAIEIINNIRTFEITNCPDDVSKQIRVLLARSGLVFTES